ncbi:MAG: secondary thiamine-phosphate synthase enzyme YjbQ, partial [Calditrichia bacterium]
MEIITRNIAFSTQGFTDIIEVTSQIGDLLKESKLWEGQVTLFIPGSTAGLTTIEYEPGLLKDLPDFFESIIPMNKNYQHDNTWHDGNGYAHLRASLLKPSLTVPFSNGRLLLGTWQQIIFVDFDNRSRQRKLIAQFWGDK